MNKLDRGLPNFGKFSDRKASFGNLYRQDRDLSPDHYDSVKIANSQIKQRKKSECLVDMKKSSKRDMTAMW